MANIITKTFTYDLPDDYLSQQRTLDKTAEWTYIGPEEICLVVNKETNTYAGIFLTHDHDKDNVPVPIDKYHVHVSCEDNPLLCALAHAETEKPDYADLEQQEELLPDGLTYKRPLHPPPDHTHDILDIQFDPTTQTAITPYPWKKPHMDWTSLRSWRNGILRDSDDKEHEYMPQHLNDAWAEYRQILRDLPQVHGASNSFYIIDLNATTPVNTVGQPVLQLTSVDGIELGDEVGMTDRFATNLFRDDAVVVSIDLEKKQVTFNYNLLRTPSELDTRITISPVPATDPWKIGAYTAPDGSNGPDGDNPPVIGNVVK